MEPDHANSLGTPWRWLPFRAEWQEVKYCLFFIKRGFEAASGTSRALLHGLAGGLGGAVNLASHGFHVFSYSADRIAGGESKGCGERQKGGFDIHYLKRG
jgi:hypothetical protein